MGRDGLLLILLKHLPRMAKYAMTTTIKYHAVYRPAGDVLHSEFSLDCNCADDVMRGYDLAEQNVPEGYTLHLIEDLDETHDIRGSIGEGFSWYMEDSDEEDAEADSPARPG